MATKPQINRAIAVMIAAYPAANRQDDALDQFVQILARTLEPYPVEVLSEMVNPRTGLIASAKFLPSIAEVRIWCDRCWDRLAPRPLSDPEPVRALLAGPSPERQAEINDAQREENLRRMRELVRELRATTAMQEASSRRMPRAAPERGATGPSEALG